IGTGDPRSGVPGVWGRSPIVIGFLGLENVLPTGRIAIEAVAQTPLGRSRRLTSAASSTTKRHAPKGIWRRRDGKMLQSISETRRSATKVAKVLVAKNRTDEAMAILCAWAANGPNDAEGHALLADALQLDS